MLRRIDLLADLGTTIITLSGGEPTLHPDLDAIIRRIRERGSMATLITNGYLLTIDRIKQLNRAGLDYLQISIDNLLPDETSKKSLKVLDRKLQWLSEYAEFGVTINSVLGAGIRNPNDAFLVGERARELGFTSTVGILHDHTGQLRPLESEQQHVYDRLRRLKTSLFSFTHFDSFQENISRGLPNQWHCRAGGRFLYVCEDGLVHYCSQQRGHPGIPLENYTVEDIRRESSQPKGCAPFCTISCVHQTAMLDDFREKPRETLRGILDRRRALDPTFRSPMLVRLLSWALLDPRRRDLFGKVVVKALRLSPKQQCGQ
jgi:MoaA/NifB/PqqE/SkfB family radical SAM enzyme